jgi:hypothetical protein
MLYAVWIPEHPDSVAALLPEGLTAAERAPVFMNQYVVDDPLQASGGTDRDGFGAYSLTYLGVDLAGLDTEAGVPGRFWTHYFNSSEPMIRYAAAHGVPASAGRTTLELSGTRLVATTFVDGTPVIRSAAQIEIGSPIRSTGQLRYVTRNEGGLVSGRYPFVGDLAERFELQSVEFLEPANDVHVLRPAEPLELMFGFYSPSVSFCYPGGEGPLGSEHGR